MARKAYWRLTAVAGEPTALYVRRKVPGDDGIIPSVIYTMPGTDLEKVNEFITSQNEIVRSCKDSEEYESLYKTVLILTQ